MAGRFVFAVLVMCGMMILIDLYVYPSFRTAVHRMPPTRKKWFKRFYFFTAIYGPAFAIASASLDFWHWDRTLRGIFISPVFIFYVPKLIVGAFKTLEDVTLLIRHSIKTLAPSQFDATKISRNEFLHRSLWIAAALPFYGLLRGVIHTAYNYKIRRQTLDLSGLPKAFDGLKIVQISDIHTGSFVRENPLEEAVKIINEEDADLIFFTGDMVNAYAREALDFVPTLAKLKAKYGVVSVFGNHDYSDYGFFNSEEERRQNEDLLKSIHKDAGFRLLMNEHWILEKDDEQLAIIGSENWSQNKRFHSYGDLEKATAGIPENAYNIMLSHDPTHWEGQVLRDYPQIKATFSGHTHGGQMGVEIPWMRWSPVKYVYKHWAGHYEQGDQHLYVNCGLGYIGYPGRMGIRPEITVFTFKSS